MEYSSKTTNAVPGKPRLAPPKQQLTAIPKPQSFMIINEEQAETESLKVLLRKKTLENKFLEQENANLKERGRDLEKTVSINKEIIGALVDSIQSKDYKQCFEIFQSEIRHLMGQKDRCRQ